MSDCSKHKKEVAGISDMKVLAEMIGDLHYETFAELLKQLSNKIWKDGMKDFNNSRVSISAKLYEASAKLNSASILIGKAYAISKPFMEPKNKSNG